MLANTADPDQMPHDLGLYCLPIYDPFTGFPGKNGLNAYHIEDYNSKCWTADFFFFLYSMELKSPK